MTKCSERYNLRMSRVLTIVVTLLVSFSNTGSAHAYQEFKIIQVKQVVTSALSFDSSQPVDISISAILVSQSPLVATNSESLSNANSMMVLCGRSGSVDATTTITPLGGNEYRFLCRITDTPLTKNMPSGFTDISIFSFDQMGSGVVPLSRGTYSRDIKDSFGTTTPQSFPASTALKGWTRGNSYPRIVWNVGLAVNPPSSYQFPSYPKINSDLIIFESQKSLSRATYSINKKTQTLKVNCPSSVPTFKLGAAKVKTDNFLLIGSNLVTSTSWSYKARGIPGTTLNVTCLSRTSIGSASGQFIGYSESLPMTIKFPKS